MDDTFALFTSQIAADSFLEYINQLHGNIKFTIEYETENKLPFLDVLIERGELGFTTGVYRKPTFTGLGTNFYSCCSFNFKLNSISTLLYRAYNITSNWENFHKEIDFLSEFFKNNFYPDFLFNNFISKFLDNKFRPPSPIPTVPKLPMYAAVPFIQNCRFHKVLKETISKYFPALDLKVIPKNPLTLGSLFKFKDGLPPLMHSLVVYSFSCPGCKSETYIGATKRMLKVRIDSHKGVSHRTGYSLNKKEFSNIRNHCLKCKVSLAYENFSIVARAPDNFSLPILESLCIKQYVPSLNDQSSSITLHIA